MWTREFWLATLERVVSTIAQAAIATIGATAALHQVDWLMVASVSALAGILAVLKTLSTGAATGGSPSIGHLEAPVGRRYADEG